MTEEVFRVIRSTQGKPSCWWDQEPVDVNGYSVQNCIRIPICLHHHAKSAPYICKEEAGGKHNSSLAFSSSRRLQSNINTHWFALNPYFDCCNQSFLRAISSYLIPHHPGQSYKLIWAVNCNSSSFHQVRYQNKLMSSEVLIISSFYVLKFKCRCVNGRKYSHRGATQPAREYHVPSDVRGMAILLSTEISQEFKSPSAHLKETIFRFSPKF